MALLIELKSFYKSAADNIVRTYAVFQSLTSYSTSFMMIIVARIEVLKYSISHSYKKLPSTKQIENNIWVFAGLKFRNT